MSMNPGATAQPDAYSSSLPSRCGPMSWITPSLMATSATRPGEPLPSKTVPPVITTSAVMCVLLHVGHELHEIPVRVAHVDARSGSLAAALSRYWTLFDLGSSLVEQGVQRRLGTVPHQAEVATRWPGRRRPQREVPLPQLRAMEVDHLVTDVDLHHMGVLGHRKSERAIELDRRLGVSHREGDVIEAENRSRRSGVSAVRRHGRSGTAWRS